MKIAYLILGIVLLVTGIFFTGIAWHDAAVSGHDSGVTNTNAYVGPVFIILGFLRLFRAAATVPLPSLVRLAVVGLAILCGYGNAAAIKAVYPQAVLETSNASSSPSSSSALTPNQ